MSIEIVGLETVVPRGLLDALSDQQFQVILADIAEATRNEWIKIAQAELMTSRRDYVAGIQPVELTPGQAVISLVGPVANIVENGTQGTDDMRQWLLREGDRGVKRSAEGHLYRAIPFQHGGPDTGGAAGQPLGRPYEGHAAVEDAKKLGRSIYREFQGLTSRDENPYGVQGRLPAGLAPKLKEHHVTDIYAGGVVTGRARHRQMMTFRMISDNPSQLARGAWIRAPIQGRHYAKQVGEFAAKLAPKAFESYVKGLTP